MSCPYEFESKPTVYVRNLSYQNNNNFSEISDKLNWDRFIKVRNCHPQMEIIILSVVHVKVLLKLKLCLEYETNFLKQRFHGFISADPLRTI